MKNENPPRAVRWMLEHFASGTDGEALAGDLLEEFRAGRGAAWYWRQALAAVAIGFARTLWERRMVVVFSLLYCFPMPWLWLRWVRYEAHGGWMGHIWAMPWPWSTIVAMAMGLLPEITAVWIGIAIYVLLHFVIERPLREPRVWRGMWVSALTWWLPMVVVAVAPVHGVINTNTATVAMLMRDPVFLLMKVPQFVAVIVGIWVALPKEKRRPVAVR